MTCIPKNNGGSRRSTRLSLPEHATVWICGAMLIVWMVAVTAIAAL